MFSNHFLSPFILLAPWTFCGSKMHNGIVCWVKTYFLWAVLSLSLFHRISDWLRPKGALQVNCSNHPAQAGPPRACFPKPCPDGFGITPWKVHNLPEKYVPVLSHCHRKKLFPDIQKEPPVFLFVPIAPGPGTGHHWRVWLQPLYNIPTGIYTPWWDPALSAFAHRRSATVPSSPLWLFAGWRPLCPMSLLHLFILCHS